jgi:hypothetical protein
MLKECISKCTQRFYLTYKDPIVLRTDASNVGIGAVLLQLVDNKE